MVKYVTYPSIYLMNSFYIASFLAAISFHCMEIAYWIYELLRCCKIANIRGLCGVLFAYLIRVHFLLLQFDPKFIFCLYDYSVPFQDFLFKKLFFWQGLVVKISCHCSFQGYLSKKIDFLPLQSRNEQWGWNSTMTITFLGWNSLDFLCCRLGWELELPLLVLVQKVGTAQLASAFQTGYGLMKTALSMLK